MESRIAALAVLLAVGVGAFMAGWVVSNPALAQSSPTVQCESRFKLGTDAKMNAAIAEWMTARLAEGHTGFIMVPLGSIGHQTLCTW